MSTRVTKTALETIIADVLQHRLEERFKLLSAFEASIAQRLYHLTYTPDQYALMESAPTGAFRPCASFQGNLGEQEGDSTTERVAFRLDGTLSDQFSRYNTSHVSGYVGSTSVLEYIRNVVYRLREPFTEAARTRGPVKLPEFCYSPTPIIPYGSELANDMKEFFANRDQLVTDALEIGNVVVGIFIPGKTYSSIIAAYPNVAPFVPQTVRSTGTSLAIPPEKVDEILDLPVDAN